MYFFQQFTLFRLKKIFSLGQGFMKNWKKIKILEAHFLQLDKIRILRETSLLGQSHYSKIEPQESLFNYPTFAHK